MLGKWLYLCFIAYCGIAGCSNKMLHIDIFADPDLNLDRQQRPLPVVIRTYQLTQPLNFEQASFRQLWKTDADILKNTLLDKQEIKLYPGEHLQYKMPLRADTQYIGLVAIFLHPEGGQWRLLKSLKQWSHLTDPHVYLTVVDNMILPRG